ncbi:MAG: Na+/H+ antiporter, partial [Verrucomicrobiota bacterium]
MKPVEAFVLLMCAVIGVVLLGRRLKISYPIALVIGGLCISLIPGLPALRIHPDVVFLLFLPPLLYAAAWFTSLHDFKANLRPILFLSVGLVLFTTLVVGWAVHALIPAIPLAVAFALGAIVSPPDAVAATSIAKQVGLPKRVVTVLEGESLVNDATGLVALRFAIAAVASGTFSAGEATFHFLWIATGGLAIGLAAGVVLSKVAELLKDESLLITLSLLAPYIAYLPAERLHVSGVLAAVAAGLYGGWKAPELLSATTRLTARAVWDTWIFLLNCVVFILIGLQLPEVLQGLGSKYTFRELAWYGTATSAIVILVRPLWVFPGTWLPRWMSKSLAARDPTPPWRHIAIVSWCGMRGVVSLAAALALPTSLDGRPFPERNLVMFLTFCVILSTLVLQGLSLPILVRWLGLREKSDFELERQARLKIAQAALDLINKLGFEEPLNEASLKKVKSLYEERICHLNDSLADVLGWSPDREQLIATRQLWRRALEAERCELIRLRRLAQVEEDLMHRIER